MDKLKIRLRSYVPNETIWENIVSELDSREVLDKLNTYHPKAKIWENIEEELQQKKLLPSLPNYVPKDRVWEDIEKRLRNGRVIQLNHFLRYVAIGLILMGLSSVLYFLLNKRVDQQLFEYSEIWVEPINIETWNLEEDQDLVGLIINIENENPSLLKNEEYLELKTELESLLSSKQELLQELNPYDDHAHLELILTRIELEKNSIMRSILFFNRV